MKIETNFKQCDEVFFKASDMLIRRDVVTDVTYVHVDSTGTHANYRLKNCDRSVSDDEIHKSVELAIKFTIVNKLKFSVCIEGLYKDKPVSDFFDVSLKSVKKRPIQTDDLDSVNDTRFAYGQKVYLRRWDSGCKEVTIVHVKVSMKDSTVRYIVNDDSSDYSSRQIFATKEEVSRAMIGSIILPNGDKLCQHYDIILKART